ncbi:replication protein A 70 kDa dna-binding subunit, partial [Trifolium medium]|nr:replication protein A 70 kDa dna-binding subunit [Trifolium medium]
SPVTAFAPDYDTNYLFDIMGMLTGMGTQKEYEHNDIKTKMVSIELQYDGFKFKVTLFGPYVDELNAFVAAGKIENTLVVILMAKVKTWQDIHNVG